MGRCIIVTGMHRSGTSLLASYLKECGLNIGEKLIAPNFDNPKGYFEDIDFVEFHKMVLAKNNMDMLDPKEEIKISISDLKVAKRILDSRKKLNLWGWKDPRTVLFLDLWDTLIEDARYIFIYRDPSEVIDSLIRRGTDHLIRINPFYGAVSWIYYNRKILEFVCRNAGRCVLVNVRTLIKDSLGFIRFINKKFSTNLKLVSISKVFEEGLLKSRDGLTEKTKVVVDACGEKLYEIYTYLEKLSKTPDIGYSSFSPAEVVNAY